jgi:hypothetical protein
LKSTVGATWSRIAHLSSYGCEPWYINKTRSHRQAAQYKNEVIPFPSCLLLSAITYLIATKSHSTTSTYQPTESYISTTVGRSANTSACQLPKQDVVDNKPRHTCCSRRGVIFQQAYTQIYPKPIPFGGRPYHRSRPKDQRPTSHVC